MKNEVLIQNIDKDNEDRERNIFLGMGLKIETMAVDNQSVLYSLHPSE
jgi:hypothetical protein